MKSSRHQDLIRLLAASDWLTTEALAAALGVSKETIRG